jgi:hypothetical protein
MAIRTLHAQVRADSRTGGPGFDMPDPAFDLH